MDLTKIYTRALLKMLRSWHYQNWYLEIHDYSFNRDYHLPTIEELKAELATREHIPNKQEAKVLRQQKAKLQKSR